jgi:hypothetical protein
MLCEICGGESAKGYHFHYGLRINATSRTLGTFTETTTRYRMLGEDTLCLCGGCVKKRVRCHYFAGIWAFLAAALVFSATVAFAVAVVDIGSRIIIKNEVLAWLLVAVMFVPAAAAAYAVYKASVRRYSRTLGVDISKCDFRSSVVDMYREKKADGIKASLSAENQNEFTVFSDEEYAKLKPNIFLC